MKGAKELRVAITQIQEGVTKSHLTLGGYDVVDAFTSFTMIPAFSP
jgi:hypothetical protein